jgi:ABC-type nitrate/sulfonate/bicarbonate transport system substrate-binding protein
MTCVVATTSSGVAAASQKKVQYTSMVVNELPGLATSWLTLVGVKEGFFHKAGLNVTLAPLPNGPTSTAALISGSFTVVPIDLFNAGPALAQGVKMSNLAEIVKVAQVLVAAPGVPTKALSKTFPLPSGTTVGANSVAGASPAEVKFIQSSFGGNPSNVSIVADPSGAGLNAKTEPYAYVSPALACVLKTQGAKTVANMAVSSKAYPPKLNQLAGLPDNGYWAMDSWIDSHKAAAKAFQQAVFATSKWASTHIPQVTSIIRQSELWNLPTLSDAQMTACVKSIAPSWQPVFNQAAVKNWNTILQEEQILPSGYKLPKSSNWSLPGAVLPN